VYLALALTAGSLSVIQVKADEKTFNVTVSGASYSQSGARTMLDLINAFRQSEDAWYYTDNSMTEKTYVEGLGTLTYDYGLEQIAMRRGLELVMMFSHVRPDGSRFYDLTYGGISSMGENLAMGSGGYLSDAASVFASWQETDYGYDNQGHRRNMLKEDWTAVGIAHVCVGGFDFWVQEFSTYNSGLGDAGDSGSRTVRVNTDVISVTGASCAVESVEAKPGEAVDVPAVTLSVAPSAYFDASFEADCYPEWVIGNILILTTLDGQFLAVNEGETTLTVSVAGYSFTLPVCVRGETESSEVSEGSEGSQETSEMSQTSEISETSGTSEASGGSSEITEISETESSETSAEESAEESSEEVSAESESSTEASEETSSETSESSEASESGLSQTEASTGSETSDSSEETSPESSQTESSQTESSGKESSVTESGTAAESVPMEETRPAEGKGGAAVGIAAAALAGLAIVIWLITRRRKSKKA